MFALSKIFWLIVNPINIFLALFFVGTVLLFTRFKRAGRRVLTFGAAMLLVVGIFPIGDWLTERLENRFPANPKLPDKVAGIIVLGGTINQYLTASREQPSLTGGGERLTEFLYLAKRYPDAKLIFTGGSGSLFQQTFKEAEAAKIFFDRMGLPKNRVLYESRSRNTFENASFSRDIVQDYENGQWVLITSAIHMPRAVGVFRKTGWNIVPFPVDYHTDGYNRFQLGFQPIGGLASLDRGVRELIGLIAYRILGRTENLFPSHKRRSPPPN
jgi:uncharacterized SAM-binding protein YcdF (DUF218 family)